MKKYLAAAALLTLLLAGCAAPEDAGAPGLPEAAAASASSSSAPARVEPQSLEEAIRAAKQEYSDDVEAMHALSNARRFAEKELRPVVPYDIWREMMLFEMHTEMDFLAERMTPREFHIASQKYAVMVEEAAMDAGLIN